MSEAERQILLNQAAMLGVLALLIKTPRLLVEDLQDKADITLKLVKTLNK